MECIETIMNLKRSPISLHESFARDIINQARLCVVGDLHGNFVKLIHSLVHLNFISFRTAQHARIDIFEIFAGLYRHDNCTYALIAENLNNFFIINRIQNKTILFIGDTICDRGYSDFLTLCIFRWLKRNQIEVMALFGNHEMTILDSRPFSSAPQEKYFVDLAGLNRKTQFFQSFDYFRLADTTKREFHALLREYFIESQRLFLVLPSPADTPPILLTHAPVTRKNFDNLVDYYEQDAALDPQSPMMHWHDLFHVDHSSQRIQEHFNHWFTQKLSKDILGNIRTADEARCWDIISDFCYSREDVPSFFDLKDFRGPLPLEDIIHGPELTFSDAMNNQKVGLHIFGHMTGAYDGAIQPLHLNETQICIDTLTGMPDIPAGPVLYVCL